MLSQLGDLRIEQVISTRPNGYIKLFYERGLFSTAVLGPFQSHMVLLGKWSYDTAEEMNHRALKREG